MILPDPKDALHKGMMYRLLSEIVDYHSLNQKIYFKGGSCAAMMGYLDRFSIDLDFDIQRRARKKEIGQMLEKVFRKLDFSIESKSQEELFYILKYQAPKGLRNTLKLSLIDKSLKTNLYESFFLKEIDRYVNCQTIETMFANKLVAAVDRYEKYQTIAGRDIYDIHHFFSQGLRYREKIIEERRGIKPVRYLKQLAAFIKEKVTQKVIDQDINYLLPFSKFQAIRKSIKDETLMFLTDEIER
jgi:predicted nucleotidyltransferase component of viral defense system